MKDLFSEKILRKLRVKKILKRIPSGGVVGDIGCGPEPLLLLGLREHILEGWGVDKKTFNRDWGNNIKTIQQSLDTNHSLPFPENKFDCLVLLAVLEHLEFPQEILREAYRILKPKGIIIATTPTRMAKPILEFLAFKLNLLSKEEIKDHKRYFLKKELIDALRDSGFSEIQHHYFELGFNQEIIAQK